MYVIPLVPLEDSKVVMEVPPMYLAWVERASMCTELLAFVQLYIEHMANHCRLNTMCLLPTVYRDTQVLSRVLTATVGSCVCLKTFGI